MVTRNDIETITKYISGLNKELITNKTPKVAMSKRLTTIINL